MLENIIGQTWVPILQKEFDSEYLQKLAQWISYTRDSKTIYPEKEDVFKALKLCPHGQVKVIIVGQDPYYDGSADGLAFSYKDGKKPQQTKKSLDVILEEIEDDCYQGFRLHKEYQLDYLAKQGVLLLNTVLTVFHGKANSHAGLGWETLTKRILASQWQEASPKVFLLWGNEAQNLFVNTIPEIEHHTGRKHLILRAKHPAADLYGKDQFGDMKSDYPNTFKGCNHFSKTNEFLLHRGMMAIDWLPTYEPYNNVKLSDDPPF
jgi:uracil-DNA glycosylase